MKRIICAVLFAGLSALMTPALFAGETPAPFAGTVSEKMAEAMKLAAPGEHHRKLDVLVGRFKTTTTFQMSPAMPVEVTDGTSETKWILDGRFTQQTFKGSVMGQPFEGLGIVGYDNVKKEYQSIWIDSVATGMVKSTMQFDEETQSFLETGTMSCPMEGGDKSIRGVIRIIDKDQMIYEMYSPDQEGVEQKLMEVKYERIP